MSRKTLQIQQLDGKMRQIAHLQNIAVPATGWIMAVRLALGISARQLGNKLSITRQGVHDRESREIDGSITIKSLREVAKSLDMKLVYGFVPEDGTLDALIEKKARELARQIVMRTSNTMKLEAQENTPERIEHAIEEQIDAIKREMPKTLWD